MNSVNHADMSQWMRSSKSDPALDLVGPAQSKIKMVFRVYWPDVHEVYVSGEFNRWSIPGHAMRDAAGGFWELEIRAGKNASSVGCFGLINGRIVGKKFMVIGKAGSFPSAINSPALSLNNA